MRSDCRGQEREAGEGGWRAVDREASSAWEEISGVRTMSRVEWLEEFRGGRELVIRDPRTKWQGVAGSFGCWELLG